MRIRSNHLEVFCKKGVLRNFAKFTGKHLCQSLFFNKVAGLRPACLLKKRLMPTGGIYAVSISDKVKYTEAARRSVLLYKKMFLEILQYSQENTSVAISFAIKLQALSPAAVSKRVSNTGVFL